MPKVSVIVPLYNKEPTIVRAIRTVLQQSFGDFEILVVDDGSTDNSVAALSALTDARLRIIRQSNAGPGAARNRGAASATSPLLAFLDADDEWAPEYLDRALTALDREPTCAAHVAAYDTGQFAELQENVLQKLSLAPGAWRLDPAVGPERFKSFVDACHSSCTVIRKAVFDGYGGYYAKNRCLYGEDSYLWLQVLLGQFVYWDPRPSVIFHVEDSALGVKMRHNHPTRPALTDPEPLRRQCPPSHRAALQNLLAYYRLIETEKLSRQGHWSAIRELRSTFRWTGRVSQELFVRERKVDVRATLTGLANLAARLRISPERS
jgi:glycosyltransferase involved in cell wall biosynthesis